MPQTALRHFQEDIKRARALVRHAAGLACPSDAERLLRDDVDGTRKRVEPEDDPRPLQQILGEQEAFFPRPVANLDSSADRQETPVWNYGEAVPGFADNSLPTTRSGDQERTAGFGTPLSQSVSASP